MYKRILFYFIIILFLSISIFSYKTYSYTKDEYYDQVENSLSDGAKIIANDINTSEEYRHLNENDNVLKFSGITNSRLTIVNKTGVVLFDSDANYEELENHASRPEIKGALDGKTSKVIRYSDSINIDMMYVATPIVIEDEIVGVVRNSVPLDSLKAITYAMIRDIVTTIFFTVIIAIIGFYLLTKRIISPLSETTEFAKEIANGNYRKRLSMIREDEIGSLTNSLNHMAKQLEYSFNELSLRNSQLESVLSNIKNGIIAINSKNEIILINNSAFDMLKLPSSKDLIGRNILEAIRNNDFYNTINNLNLGNEMEINFFEIEIQDSIYSIYTKPILENNIAKSFIIVIEDVTQIRKFENIRKDFVANVTHELKTPITSIKGFIETLISGDVKDQETRHKFYNIIEVEVNRLIRLVEDILMLSSLDSISKVNHQEVESINVKENMENIFCLMEKIAADKGVKLSFEIKDNIKNLTFNKNYFKQMMINLIDNAIKYNKTNGSVILRFYSREDAIVIEVIDSGIGIPQKDLPRLFERFYRVDQGRSRQAGGTGLGLAIVKHIVQIQNSQIQVKSTLGKGTKFIITIPQATGTNQLTN